MKVILQQDVRGKGKKGQMIEVAEATPATSCFLKIWRCWLPPMP